MYNTLNIFLLIVNIYFIIVLCLHLFYLKTTKKLANTYFYNKNNIYSIRNLKLI